MCSENTKSEGGGRNTVAETYYLASVQRANILHEKMKILKHGVG